MGELGRIDEAKVAIETAITLAPLRTRPYYHLALFKHMTPDEPHLRAMEKLAQNMSSLDADEQIDLNFALAKAYADIGDHKRSFARLADGAALKRKKALYDEAAEFSRFERIRKTFTGELMHSYAGLGDPSLAPVFIIGMPRSGTTLIEQILASHPKVFAAGEREDFAKAVDELHRITGNGSPFPETTAMSGPHLRRLGASYLQRIGAAASTADRITDKMPGNFLYAGYINLALPNARIIHARRDPMDTCFSCFSQSFGDDSLPYTYDLGELGRFYRAYEALMAHWREVLPPGAMLEVQYEEVVADLEGQARRIVAYCGLEWDARCLDFHRTERPVRTASMAQVRQPIYTSSVGRWRPYQAFLGPLRAALELDPR